MIDLKDFYYLVSKNSMTSKERIHDLYYSLEYVINNNIEGDIIECGVWKGGNIVGILSYLKVHNIFDRTIWLYDTFNGLTKPTEKDFGIDIKMNHNQVMKYWESSKINETTNNWCYSDLESVQKLIREVNYPENKIRYVVGDICETLKHPENVPDKISLLRLDTDWYESTKIEMEVLFPKLENKGVLIVDDYNYWSGSKTAVDEYYKSKGITPSIQKIDNSCIKIIVD